MRFNLFPPFYSELFTTREVIRMSESRIDHANLKDWHRRGFLPPETTKGKERVYTFPEAVNALVFNWLAGILPHLVPTAEMTPVISKMILDLLNPDAGSVDLGRTPIYCLYGDGSGGPFPVEDPDKTFAKVIRHQPDPWANITYFSPGQMAMSLFGPIRQIMEARQVEASKVVSK